ncbi:MAG: hypothetical protein QXR48_00065 [Candidatus Woesearchaeota archaeon]
MKKHTPITVLAILSYAVFYAIAWINDLAKYYGADIVFSALFILFLHFTFRFWRLNVPVYTLLVLSFASHLCGVFGWYNVSPIPLQWDHVTHCFPLFSFTVFLYNFAYPWMAERFWSTKTWAVLLIVLLSGLGIGAVIENIEFAGYLSLGYGEGGLFFGGPGDGQPLTTAQMDAIQDLGGGYINTELDLVWNAFGTIAAIILMSFICFARKKAP